MSRVKQAIPAPKLCYSVLEVAGSVGLCVDIVYQAIREGKLVAHRYGNRLLIKETELAAFIDGLERHPLSAGKDERAVTTLVAV